MKKIICTCFIFFGLQFDLNGMQYLFGTKDAKIGDLELASICLLEALFRSEVDNIKKVDKLIRTFEFAFLPKKGSDPFIKGFTVLLEKLLRDNENLIFSFTKNGVGKWYSHDFCDKMLNAIISKLAIRSLTFEKNYEKLFITGEKSRKNFSKKYLKMLDDVLAIVIKNSIKKNPNGLSSLSLAISEYTEKNYPTLSKFIEKLKKDFYSSLRWDDDNIVWIKYFGKIDRPATYKKFLDEKKIVPLNI